MPRVEHVAYWTDDLERLRQWWAAWFDATCSELYVNTARNYSSYFLELDEGARIELMRREGQTTGLRAHIAIAVGSRERVDELARGIGAIDGPRETGDGYYEAVVLDPDGNRIELTV